MPRGRQEQVAPETVAWIIELHGKGRSYAEIARRLEAAGVPTPGRGLRWYASTVGEIVRRHGSD